MSPTPGSSISNFCPKSSAKSESPVRTAAHHWNSLDIFFFWSCSGTKIIISSSVGWYKLLRTQKATSGKSLIAFQTPQEPRAHGNKYFWKVTFIFTQNRAKKVITVRKYFVCIYPLIWRWSTFIDKVIIEFGAGLWLLLIYSLAKVALQLLAARLPSSLIIKMCSLQAMSWQIKPPATWTLSSSIVLFCVSVYSSRVNAAPGVHGGFRSLHSLMEAINESKAWPLKPGCSKPPMVSVLTALGSPWCPRISIL